VVRIVVNADESRRNDVRAIIVIISTGPLHDVHPLIIIPEVIMASHVRTIIVVIIPAM